MIKPTGEKAKLAITPYPQITRQFDLLVQSVEHCKQAFPDCFHHKQHAAKESKALIARLSTAIAVLQKIERKQPLDMLEQVDLKRTIQASRYLVRQFERVAQEVERVETAEGSQ